MGLTKNTISKFSIAVALCLLFHGIGIQESFAQTDSKSTFSLGKLVEQKNPIPGEGSLKGQVFLLGSKAKVPLPFIEVVGGRRVQGDKKGKFDLVVEEGTYKIKVSCSGYKDLIIATIAVQAGSDQMISIELEEIDRGKFK